MIPSRIHFALLIVLICFTKVKAQDTISQQKKRVVAYSLLQTGSLATSIVGLQQLWYKDYPKSKFHLFDDSKEWLQMDKLGHFYSTYHISQVSTSIFRSAGVHPRNAAILGSSLAWAYLFSIEVLDGYNQQWGFSPTDILANTLGSSMALAQNLLFHREIVTPKFSFYRSPYAIYRPDVLGSTYAEQFFKDYNGQHYWLSFEAAKIFSSSAIPKWLCFSLGYSIDGKLAGMENVYQHQDGATSVHFKAERQFLFSLDINPAQLPIRNKYVKALLSPFKLIKLPFPTIGLQGGNWIFYPLR